MYGDGMTRILAIDWSGARTGARSKIWLAEVSEGQMVRLESGRSRAEVVQYVIDEAASTPDMIVGLDFAFAFPSWYTAESLGACDIEELWRTVARDGEKWLAQCEPPFWGRPEKRRPDLPEHLRLTEQEASLPAGSQPKSVFQIGGAGAVGTGSIRGMPHLPELRSAGFSIWPFHDPGGPLVVEIYPRLLTGPVKKSSQSDRDRYLRSAFPEIPAHLESVAASSEDAFDAAVSAVVMARHVNELRQLTRTEDPMEQIEGAIWWPTSEPVPHRVALHEPVLRCPFCEVRPEQVVAESSFGRALRDGYPVSRGHTLVVPREHVPSLWNLPDDMQADLWTLTARVRAALQAEFEPVAFNIGVNDGEAAGQTVGHAHIHVIPRYAGDVEDPRGGVRWVLPERADYWSK